MNYLSRTRIESLQSSLCCACFTLLPGYVPIAEAVEEELPFAFVHLESSPVAERP